MGTIQRLVNMKGNVDGYAKQHKICETLDGYKGKMVGKYEKKFL